MHHSPVAILQKQQQQRQYRASSLSNSNHIQQLGTSAGTPNSLTSSFIDHAFDHPTPTSFSQLQFLSSSVASNDGADYGHRVPRVEERFCSGFNCCGLDLDDLHHLLEHFEECHVLPGGGVTGNPTTIPSGSSIAATGASARKGNPQISALKRQSRASSVASTSSLAISTLDAAAEDINAAQGIAEEADNEMEPEDEHNNIPEFDDFDEEHTESSSSVLGNLGNKTLLAADGTPLSGGTNMNSSSSTALNLLSGAGAGPMLSAPPSPAMSSRSDHYSPTALSGMLGQSSSSTSLYDMGNTTSTRRKSLLGNEAAFPNFTRKQGRLSRSPPSGGEGTSLKSGSTTNLSAMIGSALNEDAVSMTSEDEGQSLANQLAFSRRMRQPSVDSLASISTTASTASKKRSYNAAMGSSTNSANPRASGIDLSGLKSGLHSRSGSIVSTPGSSRGGTPAIEIGQQQSMLASTSGHQRSLSQSQQQQHDEVLGSGCLPPSLLFPSNNRGSPDEMTTDEEDGDEEDEDDDESNFSYGHNSEYDSSGMEEDIEINPFMMLNNNMSYDNQMLQLQQLQDNINLIAAATPGSTVKPNINILGAKGDLNDKALYYAQQNMQAYNNLGVTPTSASPINDGLPEQKRKKSNNKSNGNKKPSSSNSNKSKNYDPTVDSAAAAMFSPLSLLNPQQLAPPANSNTNLSASNIPVPVVPSATSPNSQATASAATLAAIQAAAANSAFPDASTPTGRIWVPNNAKPFKCPVPGCDKAYKQQNGLKYHRLHGHCNSNATGKEGEEDGKEEDKPFGCYVGPACGKKYKNMNGLRYHYQHSGAHGQIGLQMLSNGTHPPPAYPPGHKRSSTSKHNSGFNGEFSDNPSSTVVMNQSTAEALLAAISNSTVSGTGIVLPNGMPASPTVVSSTAPNSSSSSSGRHGSRVGTPASMSRNASPHGTQTNFSRTSQKERDAAARAAAQQQREIEEFDASWDQ